MRVMIVTHDRERRSRLAGYLGDKGYDVILPSHRQDVVPLAKQIKPHVIVLDLYVANPCGPELLRELRVASYTGKVVALAGESLATTLVECSRIGIDSVVGGVRVTNGPLDPGQVETAMRVVFHGDITQRAYQLWLQRGKPTGEDHHHWIQAEQELFSEQGPPDVPHSELGRSPG